MNSNFFRYLNKSNKTHDAETLEKISGNKENKKIKNDVEKELKDLLNQLLERYEKLKESEVYNVPQWIEEIKKALKNPKSPYAKLVLEEIKSHFKSKEKDEFQIKLSELKKFKIPEEIKNEIILDFKEAINSFRAKNYRAAIMLCARLLETVLFRKYYDLTGKDLLETAPGYGLGKLVAELRKLNQVDPAIMQQIHLINQIRIYSVHKKKDVFLPSEEQTKAVILYTYDLIKKLYP